MQHLECEGLLVAHGFGGRRLPVERVARFYELWRRGFSVELATRQAGISRRSGYNLIRKYRGMPPTQLNPVTFLDADGRSRFLTLDERDEIAVKTARGVPVRQIARELGRAPSTISRELRRNTGVHRTYRAGLADRRATERRQRPKLRKLEANPRLWAYVWEALSGPEHWSPQQISVRVRMDFPDDEAMRISPEAIYRTLYVFPRGEMKKQVKAALRSGRSTRAPRIAHTGGRLVPRELLIAHRPPEVADRAVPGDWEGDCIIGAGGTSQIGTLVERTTRFTILLHLPTTRTGEDLRAAISEAIGLLPAHLKRSITWDQGTEMRGAYPDIALDHNLKVWFCDPHSPWQRGTNENTNGLLRQYFPKGTDLSVHTRDDLDQVAAAFNNRPRAVLGFRTPTEAFTELLASPH